MPCKKYSIRSSMNLDRGFPSTTEIYCEVYLLWLKYIKFRLYCPPGLYCSLISCTSTPLAGPKVSSAALFATPQYPPGSSAASVESSSSTSTEQAQWRAQWEHRTASGWSRRMEIKQ